MKIINLIDRMKLFFRKDKELYSSMYSILGFYPHDISLYRTALTHKSMSSKLDRGKGGRSLNNERLEFLGDAILEAVSSDAVFRKFPGKNEGFLTNTRSKLVQRKMLNKLSEQFGLNELIVLAANISPHNNYLGGNALEALIGAVYLDRGYAVCQSFINERLFQGVADIEKIAESEINFKSKLIEWCQKNKVVLEFTLEPADKENPACPEFTSKVLMEKQQAATSRGLSKKECHQKAAKEVLDRIRQEPQFVEKIFKIRSNRLRIVEEANKEPEPLHTAPRIKRTRKSAAKEETAAEPVNNARVEEKPVTKPENKEKPKAAAEPKPAKKPRPRSAKSKEVDLSDMPAPVNSRPAPLFPIKEEEKSKEDLEREAIIRQAEEAAFLEGISEGK